MEPKVAVQSIHLDGFLTLMLVVQRIGVSHVEEFSFWKPEFGLETLGIRAKG